eukprot:3936262-Pyramimonas_sp.AAC.1
MGCGMWDGLFQHVRNKNHALVCSNCFRYVGSVEAQIARRLLPPEEGGCAISDDEEDECESAEESEEEKDEEDDGKQKLKAASTKTLKVSENPKEESTDDEDEDDDKDEDARKELSVDLLKDLLHGAKTLPHTGRYQLPPACRCKSGCDEVFCSSECNAAHWEAHHELLCTRRPNSTGTH